MAVGHGGLISKKAFLQPRHTDAELLTLDDALSRLETVDPLAAKLVKLRYFAGLTMAQTADALGITLRTAERELDLRQNVASSPS